ncbi:MAG: methylmalonyl Co-A mutase-associated GTPase MeaB [Verrucomicrobiae bacterium]|nr:methylmalonyl Co-A mutase-associated GTPase MeaB [Verrucomicrobiae bacterium]NNJ42895.1 methylmalonyl Co-A mutase-associated GTPase MeaB [Akkermansiaceae bacterium]
MPHKIKPDWQPDDAQDDHHHGRYAGFVAPGVEGGHDGMPGDMPARKRSLKKRRKLSLDDYEQGILNADKTILSRAITLVESNLPEHEEIAQALLQRILPQSGKSIRVGITGVPGVGKSTLIESLGCMLCAKGHRVAILAVDPSSTVHGGSILGDKTRMENLVREPNAYIRPSPSSGSLGGVGRKSRETMLLCEASGYDIILVETVGVGQNEVSVRSMVDFFFLVMLAGAGDELQGMKKGVIEIADLLAVNKADGDNLQPARLAASEYGRVLEFLQPATPGWKTCAVTCSAFERPTLESLWEIIEEFSAVTQDSGAFADRRKRQSIEWMHAMIEEELRNRFLRSERIQALLPEIEAQVASNTLPVTTAVNQIMHAL